MNIGAQHTTVAGSRQSALIALQVIFICVALAVFSLRIYTRARLLRSIGSDDYVMGVAMLLSISLSVNACVSAKYGWGLHVFQIPFDDFRPVLFCIWLSEILFTLAASFVKLSILLFYLRLATTAIYRRVIYSAIAFLIAWAATFTIITIFQCNPPEAYWNPATPPDQCLNPEIFYYLQGVTSTLADVFVYVLPMRMVWKVQLPKGQKMGLMFVFGVGFLVCVAASLRLYYSIRTNRSDDATWVGVDLSTWEGIELNLGIVCASVPCLKALVARVVPKLMTSNNDSFKITGAGLHHPRTGNTLAAFHAKDIESAYTLRSVVTIGSGGKRNKDRGESQEDLTDGRIHKHTMITSSFED